MASFEEYKDYLRSQHGTSYVYDTGTGLIVSSGFELTFVLEGRSVTVAQDKRGYTAMKTWDLAHDGQGRYTLKSATPATVPDALVETMSCAWQTVEGIRLYGSGSVANSSQGLPVMSMADFLDNTYRHSLHAAKLPQICAVFDHVESQRATGLSTATASGSGRGTTKQTTASGKKQGKGKKK